MDSSYSNIENNDIDCHISLEITACSKTSKRRDKKISFVENVAYLNIVPTASLVF